ncbi:hypothetical protein CVT25_008304 [Psilocybe cyanescens]|uniref:Uncharacterized protein n=1 Tax=Psilocybe cyanescens TaxID=93625 RepID=A0A409XJK1_PSICY|nr:hypothetical protein CVT25_008304 [Psilocybe cyanescens]
MSYVEQQQLHHLSLAALTTLPRDAKLKLQLKEKETRRIRRRRRRRRSRCLRPARLAPPHRQRIASSDRNVFVCVYRVVMYVVEKRYKAEMARAAASATSSAPASRSTSPTPLSIPRESVVVVVQDNNDDVVADVPSTAGAALDVKYLCRSDTRH